MINQPIIQGLNDTKTNVTHTDTDKIKVYSVTWNLQGQVNINN